MKKLFALLMTATVTLVLAGCFSGGSNRYTEGKDYQVLNVEKSSSPIVTEYFSFYCPHCNAFEPTVKQLKEHIKGKAEFEKVPVLFMGGQMAEPMAKGYAVMTELNVDNRLVPLLFNRIHNQKRAPQSLSELRNFFVSNGVEAAKYNELFNSFAISSKVQQYNNRFKDAGLTGVPAIVVNNKYVVNLAAFQKPQNAFKLIDYLLTL